MFLLLLFFTYNTSHGVFFLFCLLSCIAAPYAFLETLRERMFKPSLSSIIGENTKYSFLACLAIWFSLLNVCNFLLLIYFYW